MAYIPSPLPPNPPIELDPETVGLLSRADQALGKLDGIAALLPNPDLFVGMYVRKEALLSSQIEGIDSTLDEIIRFEEGQQSSEGRKLLDTEEVVNYVRALNHGIRRLTELPLCLRLIREIHTELMHGVRGQGKTPGEFRTTQNWIGPQGANLANAIFVPPPAPDMANALHDLEIFLHARDEYPSAPHYPVVIECALIHAQFETIHPFLDGNGRLGRLLVALLLHQRRVLTQPLLYLSLYLKGNRLEYYDRLTAVRKNGDWGGWTKFFLKGIEQTAQEALNTARKVIAFREKAIQVASTLGTTELKLVEFLFSHPLTDVQAAQKHLGTSYNTSAKAIAKLEKSELVREITGKQRNRVFRFSAYLELFEELADSDKQASQNATT